MSYLVTNAAKDIKPSIMVTFCSGWVVKTPVNPLSITGKDRAMLIRIVANTNNIIEFLSREFINRLGTMLRNVYANLSHGLNGFRSYAAGLDTRARDLKTISRVVAQQAFSYLAPLRQA